jgi:hypothetical protein
MEEPSENLRKKFAWPDLVVLVAFECIAIPICIAAGEALVSGDYGRAFLGWGIGIPLAIAGFTAHWWKDWLTETTRERIQRHTIHWSPVALLLAFVYVVGPNIYERVSASYHDRSSLVSKTDYDALKAQDEIVISNLREQLDIARNPPENPANTPTWLRLNFDGDGKPTEISAPNIHGHG